MSPAFLPVFFLNPCLCVLQVKCVSIKTKGNSTIYISLDAICIGKYSFEASPDYKDVSLKCTGGRYIKTIVAVGDNDSTGGDVVNGHPNITGAISSGYKCGFHHQWSSTPVDKTGGTNQTSACQGFETFTMKFWKKGEDEAWTLKGIPFCTSITCYGPACLLSATLVE